MSHLVVQLAQRRAAHTATLSAGKLHPATGAETGCKAALFAALTHQRAQGRDQGRAQVPRRWARFWRPKAGLKLSPAKCERAPRKRKKAHTKAYRGLATGLFRALILPPPASVPGLPQPDRQGMSQPPGGPSVELKWPPGVISVPKPVRIGGTTDGPLISDEHMR